MDHATTPYVQAKPTAILTLDRASAEHKLLDKIEMLRIDATRRLNPATRSELGQFLTPMSVARLMASMLSNKEPEVQLLEPGAGVGSLIAACVVRLITQNKPPRSIKVTAYEIDPILSDLLNESLSACYTLCQSRGVIFSSAMHTEDFIKASAKQLLSDGLFAMPRPIFNCAITTVRLKVQ